MLDAIELFIDDFYLVLMELSEQAWQESNRDWFQPVGIKGCQPAHSQPAGCGSASAVRDLPDQREAQAAGGSRQSWAELIRLARLAQPSGRLAILCSCALIRDERILDGLSRHLEASSVTVANIVTTNSFGAGSSPRGESPINRAKRIPTVSAGGGWLTSQALASAQTAAQGRR